MLHVIFYKHFKLASMQTPHIVLDKHCTLWSSIYKLFTNPQYWTSIQWELILESTSQTSHIILLTPLPCSLAFPLSSFWSLTCQNKRRGFDQENVFFILNKEWQHFHFSELQHLDQHCKKRPQDYFQSETSPLCVYSWDKYSQAFPLHFILL